MSKVHKETLDDIITNSGLKLDAIADRLYITPNYLWRLRKDPMKMDMKYIDRLADVLEVDVDRLVSAIRAQNESVQ